MHAISSYRGNKATHTKTHPPTDRIEYNTLLASAQCNKCICLQVLLPALRGMSHIIDWLKYICHHCCLHHNHYHCHGVDILTFCYCIHCNVYIACLLANKISHCRSCVYVECADSVTINPAPSCAQENTALTCSSTDGHPGSPNYSWIHTRLNTGTTNNHDEANYTVSGIGFHRLQCTATYTHQFCPEYYAECHASINLETFSQYLCINVKICYS